LEIAGGTKTKFKRMIEPDRGQGQVGNSVWGGRKEIRIRKLRKARWTTGAERGKGQSAQLLKGGRTPGKSPPFYDAHFCGKGSENSRMQEKTGKERKKSGKKVMMVSFYAKPWGKEKFRTRYNA